MTIYIEKSFDPLTRTLGFSAKMGNLDASFAFSETEAVNKLLSRHNYLDVAVYWINGGLTIYKERGKA